MSELSASPLKLAIVLARANTDTYTSAMLHLGITVLGARLYLHYDCRNNG